MTAEVEDLPRLEVTVVLDQILYSCEQLSKLCGFHEATVRRWCYQGEIHAIKLNGTWKIPLVTVLGLANGVKLRTEDLEWSVDYIQPVKKLRRVQ